MKSAYTVAFGSAPPFCRGLRYGVAPGPGDALAEESKREQLPPAEDHPSGPARGQRKIARAHRGHRKIVERSAAEKITVPPAETEFWWLKHETTVAFQQLTGLLENNWKEWHLTEDRAE